MNSPSHSNGTSAQASFRRLLLAWYDAHARDLPWRKDRDPDKVFVDYNQNARDHTIASAYSVRGVKQGTVSTPVRWEEIEDLEPEEFTIATVPARFARLGDLHQGIDERAYSLDRLLEWADREGLDDER